MPTQKVKHPKILDEAIAYCKKHGLRPESQTVALMAAFSKEREDSAMREAAQIAESFNTHSAHEISAAIHERLAQKEKG